jgi:broad specificity phosphatase PhoE
VTEWNTSGLYQGHSDVELSAVGRRQARAVAHRLRYEPVERIYSSDLVRARATAEAIAAAHGLQVETDVRLREFHFGEWEGSTWAEITARSPELLESTDIIAAYKPQSGETIADVIHRWSSFRADLAREDHERVLVVTHAGMLHAVMRATRPRGAEEAIAGHFRFLPASLTRLRFTPNEETLALALNDAQHLDENSPHWLAAFKCAGP